MTAESDPGEASTGRPLADGLWIDEGDGPLLVGSRCDDCSVVTFPTQRGCPRCGSTAMADHRLARRGELWTWTTQGFLPKEPYLGPETAEDFRPFALGYVELGGEVQVEGRILADPDHLRIGMELELVAFPFATDAAGVERSLFGFTPVTDSAPEPSKG